MPMRFNSFIVFSRKMVKVQASLAVRIAGRDIDFGSGFAFQNIINPIIVRWEETILVQ